MNMNLVLRALAISTAGVALLAGCGNAKRSASSASLDAYSTTTAVADTSPYLTGSDCSHPNTPTRRYLCARYHRANGSDSKRPAPTATPRVTTAPVTTPHVTTPPVTAAPPATIGIDGLYVGTVSSMNPNNVAQTQWEYLHMLSDGHFVQGHPGDEGLLGFNYAATAAEWPAYVGTWSRSGNTVILQRGNGTTESMTASSGCNGLYRAYSGACYVRLESLDGRRLSGQFLAHLPYGHQASIQLTADGHFSEHGAIAESNWHWTDDKSHLRVPFDTNPSGTGTYSFSHNTLELRYADGRYARLFALVLQWRSASTPSAIYLADLEFVPQ
jgi:hypothetical protein